MDVDEIRSAESEFHVLDRIPHGACVVSSDWRVLFWNSCLESWSGIPRDRILTLGLNDFFPELVKPRFANRIRSVFEGGPPVIFSSHLHRYVLRLPLANGEERLQQTIVTAVEDPSGNGYRALFSIDDVTDATRQLHEHRVMRDRALEEIEVRKAAESALEP